MPKSKKPTVKIMHGNEVVAEYSGHQSKARKLMDSVTNKWPKSQGNTLRIHDDQYTVLRLEDRRPAGGDTVIIHVETRQGEVATAAK